LVTSDYKKFSKLTIHRIYFMNKHIEEYVINL